jgi:phenylpropionate dioxygenase-like ring-hydroxylating dioxygenase large terminal subunit
MTETITGTNRSAGVSLGELQDLDTHPVSDALRAESPMGGGNTRVPAHVYSSKAWHDLEVEKLWSKVWQLACLEEEIPEVGDYHVYEIATLSFLIVRTGPDEFKAYRNACLHRGRKLRECSGRGAINLRCPFHGWAWNLDGSLKEIPCQWDFPDVEPANYGLAEALVDTWQGFIFINPDRDAGTLADFLGDIDDHFTHLPFDKRYKSVHVRKIMPMNWKVCQEAFMEAYHTVATHPTLMENLGDANSRYDIFGNFSRAISPHGVESPHLANMTRYERLDDGLQFARWRHPLNGHIYERVEENRVRVTNTDGHESFFDMHGNHIEGSQLQADPHLCIWVGGMHPEAFDDVPLMMPDQNDQTPEQIANMRAQIAEERRQLLRDQWGDLIDVDNVSDGEFIDAIFYSVFPNWSPWGCFHQIFYRFRPNGDDPETSIFEVMFFPPAPDPDNRPEITQIHDLGIDDDWSLAPELGPLFKVFQQDSLNLPHVQTGLKAQERQEVIFASHNESKIRHFYEGLFRWLEVDETSVHITR